MEITEGEWKAKGSHVNTDRKHVCECSQTFTISFKESEANAKLIADAGNTAQKCGLLPSELLAQRDELLSVLTKLKDRVKNVGTGYPPVDYELKNWIEIVNDIIKKSTE